MTDTQTVSEAPPAQEEVTFRRDGHLGRIVLDRPKALNALTTPMIEALHRSLNQWARDPGAVLVLESAVQKAFCAGGDIRAVRQNSVDGRHEDSIAFFTNEYALNTRLAELPTPVVSVVDGICMGGGLGLSVHGTFRVLTERAVLAMPETAIGFFPDVGASYFLSRLPGALGTFIGLTGYRLDAADALYTGLGTHLVMDAAEVGAALDQQRRSVDEVLRELAPPTPPHEAPPSLLATHRAEIDYCFGQSTVAGIRFRLAQLAGRPWVAMAQQALATASPLSLEVTLAAVTTGKQLSLRDCLAMELRLSTQLIRTHDFVEGVRAMLVDKDRSPRWAAPGPEPFDYAAAGLWNRAAAPAH